MGRGKVLSEEERAQIRAARDQGLSLRAIATQLQRSRTVVGSYLNDPEGYNTRKATGRPCKLSAPEMERLLQEATTRGHVSARELRNDLDLPVSVRRVNGYLRQQKRHRSSLTPAPDDEDTVMIEAQGDVLMAQALPDAVATAWKSEHQPNQLPIPPATFGIASTSMASPEDVPLKTVRQMRNYAFFCLRHWRPGLYLPPLGRPSEGMSRLTPRLLSAPVRRTLAFDSP